MTLIDALTAITLQAGGLPPAENPLTPAERQPAEVTFWMRNIHSGQLFWRAIKVALVGTRGARVRGVVWLEPKVDVLIRCSLCDPMSARTMGTRRTEARGGVII